MIDSSRPGSSPPPSPLRDQLRAAFVMPDAVVKFYVEDMTDDDLRVRATPETNHWNWQWGHLIVSEVFHIESLGRGAAPELSDEFRAAYSNENSRSDDPADFLDREALAREQLRIRTYTFETLEGLSEEQLVGPTPPVLDYLGPTVASVFTGEIVHWMMHIGQLTVIRKRLGKPTY